MLSKDKIILVTGATGSQGGAVAEALLKKGNTVRVIIRKSSLNLAASQKLKNAGAEIRVADLDDKKSIERALENVYGLFSVQAMSDGTDSERRHADILMESAVKANVQHLVHVSVSQLGNYENFPGWGENRWNESYWTDKKYAEEKVKNSGFKHWTVLRPTFLMDNFTQPKVDFMYPGLDSGKIMVIFNKDKKLQFVDVADIGEFAAAAFNTVEKFDRQIIELAGDELTIDEISDQIAKITGKPINVEHISEAEGITNGMVWPYANYQEWANVVGYNVDINALKSFEIPLTSFAEFLEKNRNRLPL